MAQSCPHCGVKLPAVVDAFCPECRADLSLAPEEVTDTALTEHDDEHALRDRVYIICLAVSGALLFASGLVRANGERGTRSRVCHRGRVAVVPIWARRAHDRYG